jgi:hypothetical protein
MGMPAVWSYLAATYDLDRDGRITPAEHRRDPGTFARLDRDEDRVLTRADFEGPARMDEAIGKLVLVRHLALEPGKGPPDAEGLARAFARLDVDHDGRLDRGELDRALRASKPLPAGSPPEVPKGVWVYDSLLALLDEDGSRDLGLSEVEAFRARLVAEAAERPRRPPAAATSREEGPAVGDDAPDFTLATRDGASTLTLSEFRGRRPVALLFGSWT